MLLVLDVGNTNTVLGVYARTPPSQPVAEVDGSLPVRAVPGEFCHLVADWRVATTRTRTVDEYGVLFRNLFAMGGVDSSAVSGIVISSVVPPMDPTLREVCERYFGLRPLFIEPGVRTGMPVRVDSPAEVGADRIVNGVAAFEKYGGPCIVVDFGTATSFDAISAKGEFLGGAIAPGLGISAEALFQRAARLQRVEIRKPPSAIGTSTVTNLQSGLYYGYLGLVDGLLERMIPELGDNVKVVATGGLASLIGAGSRYIRAVDDRLTLEGLRIIWERHTGVARPKAREAAAAGIRPAPARRKS
jgi:type III pantothenate kinase